MTSLSTSFAATNLKEAVEKGGEQFLIVVANAVELEVDRWLSGDRLEQMSGGLCPIELDGKGLRPIKPVRRVGPDVLVAGLSRGESLAQFAPYPTSSEGQAYTVFG